LILIYNLMPQNLVRLTISAKGAHLRALFKSLNRGHITNELCAQVDYNYPHPTTAIVIQTIVVCTIIIISKPNGSGLCLLGLGGLFYGPAVGQVKATPTGRRYCRNAGTAEKRASDLWARTEIWSKNYRKCGEAVQSERSAVMSVSYVFGASGIGSKWCHTYRWDWKSVLVFRWRGEDRKVQSPSYNQISIQGCTVPVRVQS
jgi:hypothetical protein